VSSNLTVSTSRPPLPHGGAGTLIANCGLIPAMDFDQDDSPECAHAVFRAFALACRVERDRRALAGIAADDLRFETALADRHSADAFAARLIAAAKR
jgi:hypothetical protein